jgi:inner membrane organizing system protein 1
MSESNKLSKSELELGQKWDRCLSDGIIKTGSGLGVGLVFSLLFFKSNSCL